MKTIGIAFSDIHIHKFRDFNENNNRLNQSIRLLDYLIGISNKLGVPIFFPGDLFHNAKEVENETLGRVHSTFRRLAELFFAISGNHDMSEKNTLNHISPTYLNAFHETRVINMDNATTRLDNERFITGIPYMNSDKELMQRIWEETKKLEKLKKYKHILMLHGDAPGAINPMGFGSEPNNEFYKPLKKWDLVLMGHIHKPQRIKKNVYMLGSPIHQMRGDIGNEMGYWKIHEDLSLKFIPLNHLFPEYVYEGGKPGDYVIPKAAEIEAIPVEIGKFHINTSKKKLAKRFCKAQGIKSKAKVKKLAEILNKAQ